jgi:hypothetical protein
MKHKGELEPSRATMRNIANCYDSRLVKDSNNIPDGQV